MLKQLPCHFNAGIAAGVLGVCSSQDCYIRFSGNCYKYYSTTRHVFQCVEQSQKPGTYQDSSVTHATTATASHINITQIITLSPLSLTHDT
jgi:hypothetical protein